jgi:hypothetical protein
MSGLIVGLVLRLPITDDFNSEAKFIATVYAEHAWEDGTHAYPAVETVAKITGFSKRTVQRYLKTLRQILLVPIGKGPRGTTRYDFPLVENPDGSVRLAMRGGDSVTPLAKTEKSVDSGDTQTPRQPDGGDTESGDTESGDSIVSPEPITRHLKPKEEEGQEVQKISLDLQEALKDLGIYLSVWNEVKKRLLDGWVEADVFALISWMRKTTKDKTQAAQRFVKRVREGTKAPREFYPRQQPVVTDAADDQASEVDGIGIAYDQTVTTAVLKAWSVVVEQLGFEMKKTWFEEYVQTAIPVHFDGGILLVGVLTEARRDWLESRLASSFEHLMSGAIAAKVEVKFVVVEAVAMETEA